jgi:hypothetical protein
MIPELTVREWSATHTWPLPSQVEQDLLLSRAICEIAAHPYLSRKLVFRGGTALHKLHLPEPRRYSEDLDYVRTTAGGIGPLVTALGELGRELGFTASSVLRLHPKVVWKTTTCSTSGWPSPNSSSTPTLCSPPSRPTVPKG